MNLTLDASHSKLSRHRNIFSPFVVCVSLCVPVSLCVSFSNRQFRSVLSFFLCVFVVVLFCTWLTENLFISHQPHSTCPLLLTARTRLLSETHTDEKKTLTSKANCPYADRYFGQHKLLLTIFFDVCCSFRLFYCITHRTSHTHIHTKFTIAENGYRMNITIID